MQEVKLPIEVVPGTTPPIFRWRQTVDTINGKRTVEHLSSLPATVEDTVALLIGIAKQLVSENRVMRGSLNMAVDRLGGLVEGKPTHDGNYLQRIDELTAIEAEVAEPVSQSAAISSRKVRGGR